MSISREALNTGESAQALRSLLQVPVRVLQTPVGRRAVSAGALALALQGVVGLMFSEADAPIDAATPVAVVSPAPAAAAPTAAAPTETPAPARDATKASATPARKAAFAEPGEAAAAWFARKTKVDPAKVTSLQQVTESANKVRVLVMAVDGDRVDTKEVTVTRSKAGWSVR